MQVNSYTRQTHLDAHYIQIWVIQAACGREYLPDPSFPSSIYSLDTNSFFTPITSYRGLDISPVMT